MKPIMGIVLAFAVGFACRSFGIPSLAPPLLVGALLVLAMTLGYSVTDRFMRTAALHAKNCAGPSGKVVGNETR
jgi:XapX domain-containing protein